MSLSFKSVYFKSSTYLKKVRESHFERNSILITPNSKNIRKSIETLGLLQQKIDNENEPVYSNKFLRIIGDILRHEYFDVFMLLITLLSMIIMTLDSPIQDPDSEYNKTLNFIEYFITSVYMLEFVSKILVFGVFYGKFSFFQYSFFNYLDFMNIIVSAGSLFENKRFIRNFHMSKIVRYVRVIRFI